MQWTSQDYQPIGHTITELSHPIASQPLAVPLEVLSQHHDVRLYLPSFHVLEYSSYLSCFLFTATTDIDVVVHAQGVARTGEVYQLTCIVTKDSSVMTTPVINWVVSGQLFTASENGITLRPTVSNDTTSISVLQFDQLMAMHEGDYICQAGLASTTSAYTYNLAVQSRSTHNMLEQFLIANNVQDKCWMYL